MLPWDSPLAILIDRLQILEDMEREFGISCPSGLSKDNHLDTLDLETCDSQEELESTINQKEEKNKVGDALLLFFMTLVR